MICVFLNGFGIRIHFSERRRTFFSARSSAERATPSVFQNLFEHSDMSIINIYAETEADLMLEAVKRLDDVQETVGIQ